MVPGGYQVNCRVRLGVRCHEQVAPDATGTGW